MQPCHKRILFCAALPALQVPGVFLVGPMALQLLTKTFAASFWGLALAQGVTSAWDCTLIRDVEGFDLFQVYIVVI